VERCIAKIKADGAVARNLNLGSFSAICRYEHGLFLGASVMKMARFKTFVNQEGHVLTNPPSHIASLDVDMFL
jgi:hypothetical protein